MADASSSLRTTSGTHWPRHCAERAAHYYFLGICVLVSVLWAVSPTLLPKWCWMILGPGLGVLPFAAFPILVASFAFWADAVSLGTYSTSSARAPPSHFAHNRSAAWAKRQGDPAPCQLPATSLWSAHRSLSEVADTMLKWIVRDFVCPWHAALISRGGLAEGAHHGDFPRAVERVLRSALMILGIKGAQVDLPTIIVRKMLPLVTSHISAHRNAIVRLHGARIAQVAGSGQILSDTASDVFLAKAYHEVGGCLHPAVAATSTPDTRHAEQTHLRRVAERLLTVLLPAQELRSPAARIVAREVLACAVMFPLIESLTDPDTVNAALERQASAALQEQRMIDRLRATLDREQPQHVGTKTTALSSNPPEIISRSPKAVKGGQRTSPASLAAIQRMDIADARRTKADLLRQANRAERGRSANKTRSELRRDLSRVRESIAVVDARLAQLRVAKDTNSSEAVAPQGTRDYNFRLPKSSELTLFAVLHNSLALYHFLEWMERRKAGLLVQCWMSMSMFKQPLEEVVSDTEETDVRQAEAGASAHIATVQELVADLRPFAEHYFPNLACISARDESDLKTFLQKSARPDISITRQDVQAVRRSVLRAQRCIEQELQDEFWPAFIGSRAFVRAAQDLAHDGILSMTQSSTSRLDSTGQVDAITRHEISTLPTGMSANSTTRLGVGRTSHAPFNPPNPYALYRAGAEGSISIDQGTLEKARRANRSLDLLIGGAGTSCGASDRAPLFRESLFHDDEEEVDDRAQHAEATESPTILRADRLAALTDALTTVIADGGQETSFGSSEPSHCVRLPAEQLHAEIGASWTAALPLKSTAKNLATAKQHLRPAFKSSPSRPSFKGSSSSHREKVFGDDDTQQSYSTSENLVDVAASRNANSSFGPFSNVSGASEQTPTCTTDLAFDFALEHSKIAVEVERVHRQHELLSALLRKAELTGASDKERWLLTQSQRAAFRDLGQLKLAHTSLLERKARSTLVAGQVAISIPAESVIPAGSETREFAVYHIQVDKLPSRPRELLDRPQELEERCTAESGWTVARRYSELSLLSDHLCTRFPEASGLKALFPSKRLVAFSHTPLIEGRRQALETWLRALSAIQAVCSSIELEVFLNPNQLRISEATFTAATKSASIEASFDNQSLVRSMLPGDWVEGSDAGEVPNLPLVDIVGNSLSVAAALANEGVASPPLDSRRALSGSPLPDDTPSARVACATAFTEPICAFLIEIFQLKEKDQWLRRQSLIVVLQQAFGGTIERRFREGFSMLTSPASMTDHLTKLRDTIWPEGILRCPQPIRSESEKDTLRATSLQHCVALVPNVAASFMGRDNARKGAESLHAVLQSQRLNKSLLYHALDLLLDELTSSSS